MKKALDVEILGQKLTISSDAEEGYMLRVAGYVDGKMQEMMRASKPVAKNNVAMLAALRSVWKNFGVGVKRKGRGLVDHTPLTAIVDRHSVLRVAFIGPSPDVPVVLNDIRSLLAER